MIIFTFYGRTRIRAVPARVVQYMVLRGAGVFLTSKLN